MGGRLQCNACSPDTEIQEILPQIKGLILNKGSILHNFCGEREKRERERFQTFIYVFFLRSKEVQFPVGELRIEVDCSVSRSYVEIDAVEIVGGILFISYRNLSLNIFTFLYYERAENFYLLYVHRWMPKTVYGIPKFLLPH